MLVENGLKMLSKFGEVKQCDLTFRAVRSGWQVSFVSVGLQNGSRYCGDVRMKPEGAQTIGVYYTSLTAAIRQAKKNAVVSV